LLKLHRPVSKKKKKTAKKEHGNSLKIDACWGIGLGSFLIRERVSQFAGNL
jgi:hypothetical protein